MHKCAQLRQRLSTERYYESETQIKNGVNTSIVILLETKCLVRLTFRQLFFWGGGYVTDLNRLATTESHLRLRGLHTQGRTKCQFFY